MVGVGVISYFNDFKEALNDKSYTADFVKQSITIIASRHQTKKISAQTDIFSNAKDKS